MSKFDREYELLSSYLDGELSPEEIKILEEKITLTPELRSKLAELKRIKELTKSSFKKLPESPYFETRLSTRIEEKTYRQKIKKWAPVIGMAVLTVFLMVFLKFNPGFIDELFEEQKSNLAGFYKENLKPLLFAADLSTEDIFNFAFYNKLPLDKEKSQFIQFGSDSAGDEFFEINTSDINLDESNFEKFVQTLELSDKELKQFDSIMNSYAGKLQSQILVNNRNTVAISPNLWNYKKAIVADILSFAKSSNAKLASDIMPILFKVNTPDVEKVVHAVKTSDDKDYIFITPDTLFVDEFVFDEEEFRKEMELAQKEMRKSLDEIRRNQTLNGKEFRLRFDSTLISLRKVPHKDKNVNIFVDSNVCRIHFDKFEIPDITLPGLDSLEEIINEATRQIKSFSVTIPKFDKQFKEFKFQYKTDDSVKAYKFDVEIPDIDSIIRKEMEHLNDLNWNSPPDDSLIEQYNFFRYDDSTYTGNQKLFQHQMKELKDEMQKFRQEMEKLREEIIKDSAKTVKKSPVEV